jgi:hypothetical protein
MTIFNKFLALPYRYKDSLITFLVVIAAACGSDNNGKDDTNSDSSVVERKLVTSGFDFVGVITSGGSLRCSGSILSHGIFVSARHCFTGNEVSASDNSNFKLMFPKNGLVDNQTERIAVEAIEYDSSEGGVNDIAYIFYDASQTEGQIELPNIEINTTSVVAPGTQMTTVGFPSSPDRVLKKVGTYYCQRLEKSGSIEPSRFDNGYDGILYDTDCGAWKGNSGGVLYTVSYDENGDLRPLSIEGVVTHTFDLTSQGYIDPNKTKSDDFGDYVVTVNYSAFKDAVRIDEVLGR